MPLVTSGVEKGNLRELALARMGDLGLQCRDVRTREAGIQDIHHKVRAPVGRSLGHEFGEVHQDQQSRRGGTAAGGTAAGGCLRHCVPNPGQKRQPLGKCI